jgi:hypothetical protein
MRKRAPRNPRSSSLGRNSKPNRTEWPVEAFDLLLARVRNLQEQIDSLKEQVAALQEAEPRNRLARSGSA